MLLTAVHVVIAMALFGLEIARVTDTSCMEQHGDVPPGHVPEIPAGRHDGASPGHTHPWVATWPAIALVYTACSLAPNAVVVMRSLDAVHPPPKSWLARLSRRLHVAGAIMWIWVLLQLALCAPEVDTCRCSHLRLGLVGLFGVAWSAAIWYTQPRPSSVGKDTD